MHHIIYGGIEKMAETKLSFVIPCYKSALTIEKVVNEIDDVVKTDNRFKHEIILVNDNSPDNTLEVLTNIAKTNKNVKVISLAKNFGQQAAIMAGFRNVTGDIVICLDDDGQTPPDQCFYLINEIGENCDLVFAKYAHKNHSWFRNFGSRINGIMAEILVSKPKEINFTSYFACKRFVIESVIKYGNPYPYIGGLLLQATDKVCNVLIEHKPRESGHSGYTLKKLLSLWLNGFTAFSVKPLRVATIIGMLFSFIGFVYAITVVVNKLLNPAIAIGWSSTMAALLVIGGLILFMLGLIGEYIGRIYISLNNAPQYVIREMINIEREYEE